MNVNKEIVTRDGQSLFSGFICRETLRKVTAKYDPKQQGMAPIEGSGRDLRAASLILVRLALDFLTGGWGSGGSESIEVLWGPIEVFPKLCCA